jgi:hypothetical protein
MRVSSDTPTRVSLRSECRIKATIGREEPWGRQALPPHVFGDDQRIVAALCSVIQTPQGSGIPTNAQNIAALASSPPKPMPYDPEGPDAPAFAVAACSLATSASLLCHFASTGLIS